MNGSLPIGTDRPAVSPAQMTSPYVRRLRLGGELRELRRCAGLSAEELGRRIGVSRLKISRLETGTGKPGLGDVWKVLELLGIPEGSPRWRKLIQVARDAAERGWWESHRWHRLGTRQARGADLECGVATLRMYEPELIPGLLQTEAYYRSISEAASKDGLEFDLDIEVEARLCRQEVFAGVTDRTFEVVVEEQAIRRLFVPPPVMRDQLLRVLDLVTAGVCTFRVLPVDASMIGARVPRAAFELYTYADPDDPVVVHLDNVTADVLMTDPADVGPYARQFDQLVSQAMSPSQSRDLVASVAERLASEESIRP